MKQGAKVGIEHIINALNLVIENTKESYKKYIQSYLTKINIFQDINWNNFAVSGSCITACLQKKSFILEDILGN